MKNFLTVAFACAVCLSANAEASLTMLSFGSEGGPGIGEPGMIGLGISPNGRYVCGTLEQGIGIFMGDIQNDKIFYEMTDSDDGGRLNHVNDEGVAIGYLGEPGVTYDIDGNLTLLQVPSGYKYIVGQDINADGSVMVGTLVGSGYQMFPAFSRNGGEWEILDLPDMDLEAFNTKQCSANYVSDDGKIILGYIGALGPATLWRMNDEGKYEPDPFFDKYKMRDFFDTEHPYVSFEAEGMSPDGHYVLLKVCTFENEAAGVNMPAVYDTRTGELKVYDEVQKMDNLMIGLTPTAIANDGTFVGIWGSAAANGGAFIMRAGETQAEMFIEAFPQFSAVFGILDLCGYHLPADISADGRYIVCSGWYSPDEDPTLPEALFYFMSYILDTGEKSAVESVEEEMIEAVPVEYYTIDGIRTDNPVKGLYVVRMSDGSTRKVMF